jgi:hypothetical protein
VVASSPIKSPQLQPYLDDDAEKLVEWCGFRGLLLAVGISGSSRSFIDGYFFFFISKTDVVFLTRSATFRRNQQC